MHTRIIQTALNSKLSATQFESQSPAKGVVVIASALAVAQSYYVPIAQWLTAQGYHVLTFDYTGTFASVQPESIKKVDIDLLGWASNDCAAMVDEAVALYPDLPLYWLGHSMGGVLAGLIPNVAKIDKIITIASGSGYWRENADVLKRRVWALWYFIVPVVTPMFGYFPGRRLKLLHDLPFGVMMQWRRWCLHSEYTVGVEGDGVREQYARFRGPLTSFSFADDEYLSVANVNNLHERYTHAQKNMERMVPEHAGLKFVGHFGFFKPAFQEPLWQNKLLSELSI